MARKYSSTAATSALAGSSQLSAAATSVPVTTVSNWPTTYPFTIIIDPDTISEEVCTVTGVTTLTLTVSRGQDGTTGKTHEVGAVIKHGVSARDFSEPQVHIDATTSVHGITDTAALVTLAGTQTLSAKTLTSPTINSATLSGTVTNTANISGGTVNPTTLQQGSVAAVLTNDARLSDVRTPADNSVTSAKIVNDSIVDADINSAAAIGKTKISGTAVTLADTSTVTNTMLAGSIANAKLANSSVTVGSTAVALGATAATVSGLTLTSPTVNSPTLTSPTSTGTITFPAGSGTLALTRFQAGESSLVATASTNANTIAWTIPGGAHTGALYGIFTGLGGNSRIWAGSLAYVSGSATWNLQLLRADGGNLASGTTYVFHYILIGTA